MGADLLLATLMHEADAKLNWPAGRAAARRMTADEARGFCEEAFGEDYDSTTECRSQINTLITELKEELAGGGRDAYEWEIRGVALHLRGGTSWGDDPSDGYSIFSNIGYLPWAVLEAIGFLQQT